MNRFVPYSADRASSRTSSNVRFIRSRDDDNDGGIPSSLWDLLQTDNSNKNVFEKEVLQKNIAALRKEVLELEHSRGFLQGENDELTHNNARLKGQRAELLSESLQRVNDRRVSQSSENDVSESEGNKILDKKNLKTHKEYGERPHSVRIQDGDIHMAQYRLSTLEADIADKNKQLDVANERLKDQGQAIDVLNIRLQEANAWTTQVKSEYEKRLDEVRKDADQWKDLAHSINENVNEARNTNDKKFTEILSAIRNLVTDVTPTLTTSNRNAAPTSTIVSGGSAHNPDKVLLSINQIALQQTLSLRLDVIEKGLQSALVQTLKGVREGFDSFSTSLERRRMCPDSDVFNMILDVRNDVRRIEEFTSSMLQQLRTEFNQNNDCVRTRDPENQDDAGISIMLREVRRLTDLSSDSIGVCFRNLEETISSFQGTNERLLDQLLASSTDLFNVVGTDLIQLVSDTLTCIHQQGVILKKIDSTSSVTESSLHTVDIGVQQLTHTVTDNHALLAVANSSLTELISSPKASSIQSSNFDAQQNSSTNVNNNDTLLEQACCNIDDATIFHGRSRRKFSKNVHGRSEHNQRALMFWMSAFFVFAVHYCLNVYQMRISDENSHFF